MQKTLCGNPCFAPNVKPWIEKHVHLTPAQIAEHLVLEGHFSMPPSLHDASLQPAMALEPAEGLQPRNGRKHKRRGLLMHVPLLLQLAVALDSLDCAGAFVGMPSTGHICGDERRGPNRRKAVYSAEGAIGGPMSMPKPLREPPVEEEKLFGFWAPATKAAPLGSAKDFHARQGRLGRTLFSRGQPYNVVLTHIVADFDSLAAAVGVAKLWNLEDPSIHSYVVLPRGAHPSVSDFLALHLELFPILGLELLDPAGVRKVGVCDAQTRDRVGPAAELLDLAESVHVFDHHVDKDSDIIDAVLHIEHVGSATTMVTEMLKAACETKIIQSEAAGTRLTEEESTLLALGIHADTGSLTYDSATARDAAALAWLMTQGCQQTVVSEYTHTSLSAGQQSALVEAFGLLSIRQHNGISVGSVLLVNEERVAGMARVAQNLLEMSEVGVLLVGEMHPSKPGRPKERLALIGRARARIEAVDFNALFQRFGAGGHPKAAAASVRLLNDDPEAEARTLIDGLVDSMCSEQILEPELVAEDFMTSPVLSCQPNVTLSQAEEILGNHGLYALPVVGRQGDDADKLLGLITRAEISKAFRRDEEAAANRPVTGFMLTKVTRVCPSAPMHKIRIKMAESNRGGRAVVVDSSGRLRGIITRTDLLRQYQFYRQVKDRGQRALHREWVGAAAEPGEAISHCPNAGDLLSAAVAGFLG